jgi:hypothetical protein
MEANDQKIPLEARGEVTFAGKTFVVEVGAGKRPGSIRVTLEAQFGDLKSLIDLVVGGLRSVTGK